MNELPPQATVLVQGASRGIGLEFVRQLAADPGVTAVYATCRDPDASPALRELADGEPKIEPVRLDVTVEQSVAAAAETVAAHTDRLHLLVNCAGILHDGRQLQPEKRLEDVDPEQLLRSFSVNAFGPLLVARHFARLLAHRERAVFASLSARVGSIGDNRLGGWYAYRASKAAQNMFTRNLAIEFKRNRRNIICVALHPGTTDTDLSRPFQGNVPEDKLFSTERAVRQLLRVIDGLAPEDSGSFVAWDGESIPW